jgi:hypothetical protein
MREEENYSYLSLSIEKDIWFFYQINPVFTDSLAPEGYYANKVTTME